MSVAVTMAKCACNDCVCVIEVEKGIRRDGRVYCDAACADGHRDGAGCHHAGCTCHG